MEFLLRVLRDSQFLGIIVGSILTALISFTLYKLEKNDLLEYQKILRKKEIDLVHIKEVMKLIEEILILLNSKELGVVNPIPINTLVKLQTDASLVKCFDENFKNEISENIYNECIKYNNTELVKSVSTKSYLPSFSDDADEKTIRLGLINNLENISSKIKEIYYETN